MAKEDQIPVTGAFLSFAKAILHAKMLYISESQMAEELNLAKPDDWFSRCEALFTKTYAAQADAIGLKRNRQTFMALVHLNIPEACLSTKYDDLPKMFAFDPWLGMGKGGIIQLTATESAA